MGEAGRVYHPGQSGTALPRPEDRARRVRRAPSAHRSRPSTSTGRWSPPSSSSTRSRRSAAASATCAQRLCAAGAAGGDARLRLPRARPSCPPTSCCARCSGADKAAIADARLFDVFTGAGRARGAEVARDRGHAPAGREELHRRGAEGDLRADRRRRGEARRDAPGLNGRRGRGPGFVRRAGRLVRPARLALHRPALRTARRAARPEQRARRAGARLAGRSRRPAATRWRCGCAAGCMLWSAAAARRPRRLYPPAPLPDEEALGRALAPVLADDALLPWLDSAPQTNEVGRSAVLMAGLLVVAERFRPADRALRARRQRRPQPPARPLRL